jgi:hypothetical protein
MLGQRPFKTFLGPVQKYILGAQDETYKNMFYNKSENNQSLPHAPQEFDSLMSDLLCG